jgi:hypothetical protein
LCCFERMLCAAFCCFMLAAATPCRHAADLFSPSLHDTFSHCQPLAAISITTVFSFSLRRLMILSPPFRLYFHFHYFALALADATLSARCCCCRC